MFSRTQSFARIALGLACTGTLVFLMLPALLVLLPWRVGRIRVTNAFGSLIGRSVMWCAGAIYAANHTSLLDAFTTIWLTPAGTVGVAKKEVLYYPFYGQAWWLAGHVFLDRQRTERAKAALRRTAELIRDKGLHLCILPEGTRSDSGKLLPFKKGIAHMALATRLPIVPMVTIGLTRAWKRSSLRLTPTTVRIVFLPPISTEHWTEANIEQHLEELRAPFLATLPPEQLPEAS
jgi:1-acyl-sn-glycerol-3-phosphate acyltransferase